MVKPLVIVLNPMAVAETMTNTSQVPKAPRMPYTLVTPVPIHLPVLPGSFHFRLLQIHWWIPHPPDLLPTRLSHPPNVRKQSPSFRPMLVTTQSLGHRTRSSTHRR